MNTTTPAPTMGQHAGRLAVRRWLASIGLLAVTASPATALDGGYLGTLTGPEGSHSLGLCFEPEREWAPGDRYGWVSVTTAPGYPTTAYPYRAGEAATVIYLDGPDHTLGAYHVLPDHNGAPRGLAIVGSGDTLPSVTGLVLATDTPGCGK
jgi:hypothetical protein